MDSQNELQMLNVLRSIETVLKQLADDARWLRRREEQREAAASQSDPAVARRHREPRP